MFQEQAEEEAPAIGGVRPFVLPFYTKYMLLASYLASYNPETSDTQYFSGKYEVRKRSRKKSKKVPQISAKQTGQVVYYENQCSGITNKLQALFLSINSFRVILLNIFIIQSNHLGLEMQSSQSVSPGADDGNILVHITCD
tara:strand:- start:346 stop:768 length:423 start_codon:yes stop_codon:yes gene_type:complete